MADRRYVTVEDMMVFGRSTCLTCNGTGRYFMANQVQVCRCAERRFWSKHAADIAWTDDGSVYWRER